MNYVCFKCKYCGKTIYYEIEKNSINEYEANNICFSCTRKNNNEIALKKSGVIKFKEMLDLDFKNGDITEDQYRYFNYELQINNLDYQYGLYIAYLIMK